VRLATLDALVEAAETAPPEVPLRIWRDALVAERDRVVGAADGADTSLDDQVARAAWAIEAGLAAVPALQLKHGGWRLLEPGVDRAYRDGRAALAAVGAKPSAARVHDWRKRAKDLWYQLRLLEDAWPGLLEATVAEVHRLTEVLGDHHDLAVLREDLERRPEVGADAAAFTALIEARQATLLDDALALGTRLYAEKPKAFRRRLRGYWRAWR
jgi:CHAD domain-containing protein